LSYSQKATYNLYLKVSELETGGAESYIGYLENTKIIDPSSVGD
jgi:hypothetical protein